MRAHVVFMDATHRYRWVPSLLRSTPTRGRIEEWQGATPTRISDSIDYAGMALVVMTMLARRVAEAAGTQA